MLKRVSKLKLINKVTTLVACATFMTACTTPPRVTYDSTKMEGVKTIAVATPKKTNYYAVSAGSGGAMLFIGPGILGAVIVGAVSGAVSAATSHRSNPTFNDLVVEKMGDTGLNRKFVDAIEAELRSEGYDVKEVDLAGDDMPKLVLRDHGKTQELEGKRYAGADAIMVIGNANGYFAPGSFSWYTRDVKASITIYKADTFEPVFKEDLKFNRGNSDSYHYTTYSELKDDLPRAIRGLDEAVLGLVPEFKSDLLASRGMSAKTVQTATTTESVQKPGAVQLQQTAQTPQAAKAE
jgi:hypothetical protein